MHFYLCLQKVRLARWIRDVGLPPLIGFFIAVVGFGVLGWLLLQKGPTGQYVIAGLGLMAALSLGERKRNRLLMEAFGKHKIRVRLIENVIVAIPFIILLSFGGAWFLSLGLSILTPLLSFLPTWGGSGMAIPTPFGRWPFEFPSGFRLVWPLFLGAFILFGIGIWVGNYNLGVFALGVNYLICLQFYGKMEPVFYIWVHSDGAINFLIKKVKAAVTCSSIIALIPALVLVGFYPENWWIVLLIVLIGPIYLVAVILAKYAYYPSEINIAAALGIGFSIFLPPLVLVILPIFFAKSSDNLRRYLI